MGTDALANGNHEDRTLAPEGTEPPVSGVAHRDTPQPPGESPSPDPGTPGPIRAARALSRVLQRGAALPGTRPRGRDTGGTRGPCRGAGPPALELPRARSGQRGPLGAYEGEGGYERGSGVCVSAYVCAHTRLQWGSLCVCACDRECVCVRSRLQGGPRVFAPGPGVGVPGLYVCETAKPRHSPPSGDGVGSMQP